MFSPYIISGEIDRGFLESYLYMSDGPENAHVSGQCLSNDIPNVGFIKSESILK